MTSPVSFRLRFGCETVAQQADYLTAFRRLQPSAITKRLASQVAPKRNAPGLLRESTGKFAEPETKLAK
jgi:hypothetical protein